jgi:acyl-CoA thioesterase
MNPLPEDPQKIAERCAEFMLSGDATSEAYGFSLRRVGPGEAELEMTVSPGSLNVFGTCHGGVLFTLADAAFSLACNSHGRQSVAQQCSIAFVRPAQLGDRLIAYALERCRAGRSGIYDCTITNASDGKIVAEFRGNSRTIADAMPVPVKASGS